jgi:HlyD family secretion protein
MELANSRVFVSAMDRPVVGRRLTRPALLGTVLLMAALTPVAWLAMNPADRTLRMQLSKITVSPVVTSPFHDFIPVRGEVVPLESIVLDTVQGGRIEEMLAEAGQRVSTGQPLIRLSNPSLELDVIARETQIIQQINSQRSQQIGFELTKTTDAKAVASAEYNIIRLSRELARRRPLVAKGFTSIEKLEQTADELAYERRLREIAADALQRDATLIERTNDSIEQTSVRLDANLTAVKAQLDALIVRSPADGVLTGLDARVGEEKTRGQRLGQVDRDSGFKLKVQVDEFYLARVKVGQRVAAAVDGTSRNLVVGKIYPQVKDRKFEIDLVWESGMPPGLRRGQAVQGKLQLGDDQPAMVLPAGPFLQASGGDWVFVLDHDEAKRRSVKLGRRTTEAVEVLDGLKPGDRVVTSDYTGLDRIDRLDLSS